MGKFKNGILGGFTGKVGSVVGQRLNGEWVMKAYQGDVKNPKSAGQEFYRSIFAKSAEILKNECPRNWEFLKSAMIGPGSNARTEAFRYVYAFKRFEVTEGGVWRFDSKVMNSGIHMTAPITILKQSGQNAIAIGNSQQANTPGEYYIGFDISTSSDSMVNDFINADNLTLKVWYINVNNEWAYWGDWVLSPEIMENIPATQLPNCGAFSTPDEVGARVFSRITNLGEFEPLGGEFISATKYPRELLWSIEGMTASGMPRVFGSGVISTGISVTQ